MEEKNYYKNSFLKKFHEKESIPEILKDDQYLQYLADNRNELISANLIDRVNCH